MATCGYICPSCEGKGSMDDGTPCQWCQPLPEKTDSSIEDVLNSEEII